MLIESLQNLEDQAWDYVSRNNFQNNTVELADRRANTSVTINNLEHDPEDRAFEISYQISCPWE